MGIFAGTKRAMTFDDLVGCQRLEDPNFAPDGQWIVFSVTTMNEAENSSHKEIWIVKPDGTKLQQFTEREKNSWAPQFAPDGKYLYFLSNRSGGTQLWRRAVSTNTVEQITDHYSGVDEYVFSKDGQKIAFASRVYPDCPDQNLMKQRDEAIETGTVKARVYEDLLFRHWNEWWDYKRSHLFILDLKTRKFTDLTPGDYDAPPIALGGGFCFSPNGKELYFNSNHDSEIAISTNNDIWAVPVSGDESRLVTTSCADRDFKGNDHAPQFSPDGSKLAFLSMRRAGFENDKEDVVILDLKSGNFDIPTLAIDLSVSDFQWLADNRRLMVRIEQEGRLKLFTFDILSADLELLDEQGYNKSVTLGSPDQYAYLKQTTTGPFELWTASLKSGAAQQITFFNRELLADVEMNPVEDIVFESSDKRRVHGFIIKPPFFDPQQKYPAVFMIHGGPQDAWEDEWHYRWNVQLWAAQDYVIVLINPRGSTGYGQEFLDAISGDWGGQVVQDLAAGQQYIIEKFNFVDPERIAAAGASYGGYMMNWIEGHMGAFKYPFKTLVNHDGSFNLYSMLLTTEELWFPEWEYGGPYWENEECYRKWSPHNYVQNFNTPMLIIHGEQDYRLDFSEGLMPFTALRRKGIPAKLILFPDEDHWIQKPQNSRFWHATVFDWLAEYLK
jgi:dipeptidyl aminopeptidase/acylaminoacyl peptidase